MLWSRGSFIFARKQSPILMRYLSANKNEEILTVEQPLTAYYLAKTIGSTHRNWLNILAQHKELSTVKREDLVNAANTLKSLNYTVNDIMKNPMILYLNQTTLHNRYNVFKECGAEAISLAYLAKYVSVMNRTVSVLKTMSFIPFHVDVEERLRKHFTDIDLEMPVRLGDNTVLKSIRQNILNFYLRQRLNMNDKDLVKMWKVYTRVRHRSFVSIQRMVDILLNDLQFTQERIIKNAFVLYGDPDNVQRMLDEIKTINGQDFREILYRQPKILMSSTDGLIKTIKHIKAFHIKEEAILKCLEVLTLSPDTVLERLKDLQEIEEFQVLWSNPRVLRLVHYQNKARLRLEYLNQLKVRCASLHVLSCGSNAFAKFAREGSDRTKGRDIVVFLSNVLKQEASSIRSILVRHPNWCHIPLTQVKQCYDHLHAKKFTDEDILLNLHVLLYPITRIDEKLALLYKPETYTELKLDPNIMPKINNNKFLALVLYLIEREFHFTGDGIWTEQQITQVENFHNILPDFPESHSMNRYGPKVKPSPQEGQGPNTTSRRQTSLVV